MAIEVRSGDFTDEEPVGVMPNTEEMTELERKLREAIADVFWLEVHAIQAKELGMLAKATLNLFVHKQIDTNVLCDRWLEIVKHLLPAELDYRYKQRIRELVDESTPGVKALKIRSAYGSNRKFVESRYPDYYIYKNSSNRFGIYSHELVEELSNKKQASPYLLSGPTFWRSIKQAWDAAADRIEEDEWKTEDIVEEECEEDEE